HFTRTLIRFPIVSQRTSARNELNPRQTLRTFPRSHCNHSNFSGPIRVRAATRRQIETLDLNQAQVSVARGLFSQGQLSRLTRSHVANRDRAIFPDNVVREFNCAFDDLCCWVTQIDIDLTRSFEHTKTPRGRIEESDERLREDVLSRVLLHVVQSTRPVHTPMHDRTTRRCR